VSDDQKTPTLVGGSGGEGDVPDIMTMLELADQPGEAPAPNGEAAAPSEDEAPFDASIPEAALTEGADIQFGSKRFVIQSLLEKAARVVPQKDIMPVLKNFRFEVAAPDGGAPGSLRVIATDLELSILCSTEMIRVQAGGTCVFPAKRLLDILRTADEGEVSIVVAGGQATVEIAQTKWTLKLQSGDDYPELPDTNDVVFHTIDRVKFLAAVQAVRYAAAKDSTRASLMMIDVTEGKMTACDGVRFQQAQLGQDFPLSLQIPVGAIDDLLTILRATELDQVQVGESDHYLVFRVGTDVFVANKLMAEFPDVESLMLRPALANDRRLTIDRTELVDAIKRIRINADPETSALGLRLASGQLTVEAVDKFGNAATETLTAGWAGGDMLIVVNHVFLSEMLQMYDAPSCTFMLGTDTRSRKAPVLLRDEESGNVGIIQQMAASLLGYEAATA
jgi:DNA polymerase-3 subunit beta